MNIHADTSKKYKTEAVANAVAQKKDNSQAFQFVDNRPKAAVQLKMQEVLHTSNNTNTIQMKRISIKQMQGMGFAGPYAGNTWQWNAPGGIHVTVVRVNGIATHFHVRKDAKGGVYNRINYNENAAGNWVESGVNVPSGDTLKAQMRVIAADTIRLIKALVPPKD